MTPFKTDNDMESMLPLLAQAADAEKNPVSGWVIFWLILAVMFLPYVVGSFLAKVLQLKDYSSRMGTVLFCITAATVPFCYQLASGKAVEDCFRLGIDLKGGTNLVYELLDPEAARDAGKDVKSSINNMVGAIIRRVNPSGTEEVTVRPVGEDRIEIIVPGADQAYVEEMKDRITRLGSLEFQILATVDHPDHQAFIEDANALPEDRTEVRGSGNRIAARWVDLAKDVTIGRGGPGTTSLACEMRDVKREVDGEEVTVQQVLVALSKDDEAVTGKYLTRAYEDMDQESGSLVVGFVFDSEGERRFADLTIEHQPKRDESKYRLAILLDGEVASAPQIDEPITGGRGIIRGNFTGDEVAALVAVLNAGALDIPLNTTPISEFTISPRLGADVRQKGVFAIIVSACVVVVFMAVYYLRAGMIAVLCLTLNLILIMGTMVFVQGTFTLPGLAGLVLTIGMAVDANVLIFERIREEVIRGASVRMAIHNGFGKAFSAIIDSNLTTLLVAIILFMIGTDQVRGFAVTLFIGIVMSMFSALYFGRLVFEVLDQKRMIKNLSMMSIVKSPSMDFVGKQKIALVCSIALIVGGLASFVSRGEQNLDIDFLGGTMVTFEFEEPQGLDDFQKQLRDKFQNNTIERLTREDESQQDEKGRRWRLRTTEDDVEIVQVGVAEALAGLNLKRVTLEPGAVKELTLAKVDDEEKEGGDDNEDGKSAGEESKADDGKLEGWKMSLVFSDEITPTTVARNIDEALETLGKSDEYPEPKAVFTLVGTEGSGMEAAEGEVQTFSKMDVEFRPDLGDGDSETLAARKKDLADTIAKVQETMETTPLFEEVTNFDKAVGGEMQQQAVVAMLFSLIAIVAYIWFRFQRVTFGFAAVVALVHDVLVVLGMVALASLAAGSGVGNLLALYDFKINLPMIAAFLTIVGYSLNDTIVIFDRIREVRGKNPALTTEMINRSLNQTLARTLLTSLTTFIVVAILYAFGGEGIHGFAFCLLIGVMVGTYSSIFVASPVLLWLMNRTQATAAA